MAATDEVDGNVLAYFAGKDAELLREMYSDDVPEMGKCEDCGLMVPAQYLSINCGICDLCAMGKKEKLNGI